MSQTSPKILINDLKFYSQIKSGLNFISPTDPTLNLVGNVGDRVRLEMQVDVGWYCRANNSNDLNFITDLTAVTTTITRQVGSWLNDGSGDGFCVGDTIHIASVLGSSSGTVIQINDLVMVMAITTMPLYTSNGYDYTSIVYGTTPLTALIYKFGLIGNSETFNILSKISNNEQAFYSLIVHTLTPPFVSPVQTMQKLGSYKDWLTEHNMPTVQFMSVVTTANISYQRFKIIHEFIINPFYLEDWIQYFEGNITPPLLAGLNALKHVFECEFRTVLSNPNTSKTARVGNNLGATGWFNENYNGFNNNYHIDSIAYKDTVLGTACDGLLKGSRTTATIIISTLGTTVFNDDDPNGVIISLCSTQSAYQLKITTAEENFLFDDAINTESNPTPISGTNGIIKNFSSIKLDATHLEMTIEVEYSAAQQLLIPTDAKFIIGCQIADDTLTSGNSDKVTLLADYNTFVSSADIQDLFYVTGFEITQHFVTDPTTVLGTTKADLRNESGVCLKHNFWIDLAKDAFLNSLKLMVIAYDSTTGNYFILDQYAVNLNNVIVSGGVQQINISDIRGYKLDSNDYKNKVVITTGANIANKQYYQLYVGQKVPWQDWILNIDVDTIFYNVAKPNNNLNFKASNYSGLSNYQIKFALLANVYGTNILGQSGNTDYIALSPDIVINDYDLPTTWTATRETFDITGAINLGGVIQNDADTLYRVTWVRNAPFNTGYNFWAIHRIEESGESGKNIYELSSMIPSITNNILKPVSGFSYLKVTITPGTNTVVTECLIDYTKLDSTKTYDISAEIDDGTAIPYAPVGIVTEDGTLIITEDGQTEVVDI